MITVLSSFLNSSNDLSLLQDHLKDGDALSTEAIDWSTVTPVIEAVEKAQSGEITDIVNATSQLSQLTVSVAMVVSFRLSEILI